MGHFKVQDMQVTNITRVQNCNNSDRRGGSYELVSLSGEYSKHLLSIIINNSNKHNIKYYSDENILFDLYLYLYKNILGSHCSQYYSIICKIIDEISSSLSCYNNILSFVLCHLNNVVSYIPIILSIFHCVHSEIVKLSDCLGTYVQEIKTSFQCYITKLTLDIQCVIDIEQMGEYFQNMQVSVQTCTDEFEKSICTEIGKLKSICFYPYSLFSIRDNLNKMKSPLNSNYDELSKIKSAINIQNIENLMTYIKLNCEMIEIVKSEISCLIVYVHEYCCYFNSICYYISSLNSTFCESVEKLQTSVDINIEELSCELKCDLTASNIDITCEIPDFSKVISQIDSLNCALQCHENDLHIYDCEIELCLSAIDCDYGSLIVYSDYIQDQILRNGYLNNVFFKCSFESNMKLLMKMNSYIIGIKDETDEIDNSKHSQKSKLSNPFFTTYSLININDYKVVVNKSLEFWTMTDESANLFTNIQFCPCALYFEFQYQGDRPSGFPYIMHSIKTSDVNPVSELLRDTMAENLGNHLCLCLVIKYHLRPSLLKCILYLRNEELATLDTLSRKYQKYNSWPGLHRDLWKFCGLILNVLYKISLWMSKKLTCSCSESVCKCATNNKSGIRPSEGSNTSPEHTDYTVNELHRWFTFFATMAYNLTYSIHKGIIPNIFKCFCMYSNDPYYPYLISIILFISSLIQNIWSMDNLSIIIGIHRLSSLLSEYQSLHLYTNYYSPSTYNILPTIMRVLNNGNLIKGAKFHSGMDIGIRVDNNQWSVASRLSNTSTISESKKQGETTSTSVISTIKKGAAGVLNHSTKSGFISMKAMLISTDFSKERFTLIYSKFSRMLFYTQSCNLISKGRMRRVKNIGIEISLNYLQEISKQKCDQTCCRKNGVCRICPIAKIMVSCLSISLKKIEVVLSNISRDILLNYLMGSISITEDFITNLCVGFGEVYTIMLKNNLLTHPNYEISTNPLNTMKSRNWGYDTQYEHQVSTMATKYLLS